MSELTISAYAADCGISTKEAQKKLEDDMTARQCRLRDPTWRSKRDGWPATNVAFPPTLDEYPPNRRDA